MKPVKYCAAQLQELRALPVVSLPTEERPTPVPPLPKPSLFPNAVSTFLLGCTVRKNYVNSPALLNVLNPACYSMWPLVKLRCIQN